MITTARVVLSYLFNASRLWRTESHFVEESEAIGGRGAARCRQYCRAALLLYKQDLSKIVI